MRLQKFDYQIKDNKKGTIIGLFVVILLLIAGVIIYRTFASYKVTETYNIVKGKVGSFSVNAKLNYVVTNANSNDTFTEMPSKYLYQFDKNNSSCEDNAEIVYNESENKITLNNSTGKDCTIALVYDPVANKTLKKLGDYTVSTGVPYGENGIKKSGWYEMNDNYGISYYYYAATDEDSLYFNINDNLFKIIRINGDGSIKAVSVGKSISTAFNNLADNNSYVGYKYGNINATNIKDAHSNLNDSTMITSLGSMEFTIDESYLEDSLSCNDRSLYIDSYNNKESDDTGLAYSNNITYYGAYYRKRNNTPTLMCSIEDAFTKSDVIYGNGQSKNLFGVLSWDEMYISGFDVYAKNVLNIDSWSITPMKFSDNTAYVYSTKNDMDRVNETKNVNPVINIKGSLTFAGDGKKSGTLFTISSN